MSINLDAVNLINLFLCIIITFLSLKAYSKLRDIAPAYIAVAFACFGISHLVTLLGLAQLLVIPQIVIRLLAYLSILAYVYRASFFVKNPPAEDNNDLEM